MPDIPLSGSPYPGLRPFRSDEADIFFGREEQCDALLERLQRTRFLTVVGPSGCGKSSLVRAGMIAAIEAGFMAAAGSAWRIAEMRPGDHPIARLAEALLAPAALGGDPARGAAGPALLEAQLRCGPLGLTEVLQEARLPDRTNLLLLVDQFEEIFRYREKGDPDEADAFVALLLATVRDPAVSAYVVLTMRSDFLGNCALFHGLPEAINDSQYLTPRVTREQCQSAIVGPAKVFGGDLEPALVNRLLNDFGPDPDQLPLLQHALMRMWSRATARQRADGQPIAAGAGPTLTMADYDALGGLASCLSDHADEVFNALTPAQQRIAEIMFRRLTERGVGRRDTRAPARVSDIAAVAEVTPQAVMEVIEPFRLPERSFLTPPVGVALQAETLVDIGHESLIRQWRRLAGWVDDESRSAAIYQRLAGTAQLWQAGDAGLWGNPDLARATRWRERQKPTAAWARRYGSEADFHQAMRFLEASEVEGQRTSERARREEQDRFRLEARDATRRRFTWWVSIFGVLALAAAGVAIRQAYVAQQESANLRRAQAINTQLATVAAENAAQLATETARRTGEVPRDPGPDSGEATSVNRLAQTYIAQANRAVAVTPTAPAADQASAAPLAPRVYLQIQDEQQRAPAKKIADDLARDSFVVPGIERLQTGPSKSTEIRFFRRDEEARAAEIVRVLQKAGVPDVVSRYVPGFEDSKRIRKQHFEVWFAPSAFQGQPRSGAATSQPPIG